MALHRVVNEGYAPDLTDDEVELIGNEPFLVASALGRDDRCVVTTEASKPSRRRKECRLPDLRKGFDVGCINTLQLLKVLGFRNDWAS